MKYKFWHGKQTMSTNIILGKTDKTDK